jgi:hypothetical protein
MRTLGVWSQIAMYSYPSPIAANAISPTVALPSDQVLWQCRSPRTSLNATSRGSSPRNRLSRSSGGHHGTPSTR